MKRRILSILVIVLMAIAMMPLTAVPTYAESYNLWVGGVQVTDENCSRIATTSEGAVTASFVPSTRTLTLNNYNSSGNIRCSVDMGDLTINLKGTNYISTDNEHGMYFPVNLKIQDDPSDEDVGELIVESKNGDSPRGLSISYGNLTISKCKVTAKVNECRYYGYGVSVENGGNITIEDGTLIAAAGNAGRFSYGIAAVGGGGQITIKGTSEVIASGYTEAITGPVINEIPGKGWTDINGTEGEEKIDISDTARGLRNQNNEVFRKVHLKKLPLLTITVKDQTYEYNGQWQGPGDTTYVDPAEIAELVTVYGLQEGDSLSSIIVDGQGKDADTYDLIPYGATVNRKPASEKYDVTYVNGTLTIKDKPAPEPKPEPKPQPVNVSGTLIAKTTASGKTGLTIGWNKVNGAAGYDIFFAQCNQDGKKFTCENVKTIEGNDTFKWTMPGLKKGTAYKAYVNAYVMQDGVKKYVKTSPVMHAYTGKGTKKYTNAKSVSVNKTKVSLKQGKTFKIKAKVKKVKAGKKLMSASHAPKLRYMTSDGSIATVSKSGKITAKGKGTCEVYAYAHNGAYKKIKVTVK